MIKLTFALIRREGLTRKDFQAYWRETHAPLVASVRQVLRIRRYIQSHSLSEETSAPLRASRGGPADYDGVAQLWWDSIEEVALAQASPEGREAASLLLEDERRFIDLSRSPLWWCEEHEIF